MYGPMRCILWLQACLGCREVLVPESALAFAPDALGLLRDAWTAATSKLSWKDNDAGRRQLMFRPCEVHSHGWRAFGFRC
jgi:hypothetical protein